MALNPQQLEKEGVYQTQSPLPAILAELDQIANFAESAKALKRKKAKRGGYIILGGVIGAVIGAVFPPLLVLSILAIIFGIGYLIYALASGNKLLAHPLRLGVAKERITMLLQDAGEKSPFTFRLALSSKPMQLSEEAWQARKHGKQTFLEESWLTLEGRLLDGTVVNDEIKDMTRRRTFTNPRGKHKVKTRTNFLVNVRFSYPNALYGDARPAANALHGEVKVGPAAMLRGVRVSEKAIVMKALVTSEKEITQTADMLSVGGYRILNLARRMSTGQRGKAQ
jgi:hypothetical protein